MRRRVLAVMAGLMVAPAAVEVLVRVVDPVGRTQIIAAGPELEILGEGDARYWRSPTGVQRENRGCVADDRVVVLGSSILYGSGVERAWSERLDLEGTCVNNLASPGYGVEAKQARLDVELETPPRLVVWEVWANDANRFTWVGERGYSLNPGMPRDHAGVPDAFGVPWRLNGVLFRHSRTYELLTLARATPLPATPDRRGPLDDVLARVTEAHSELLIVVPPVLDRPFAESVATPPDFGQDALAWAGENGVPTVQLAELLVDQDVEAIRLDVCCHYNEAGHAVLAERLAPFLVDLR